MESVQQILWAILLGVGIATFYVYYIRRFVGGFIRALLSIDANSEETAVTMEELHIRLTLPLKFALRKNGSLENSVGTVVSDGQTRYYVLPEKADMLKFKYRKENLPVLFLLIVVCAIIAVGLILTYCYPKLQELFAATFAGD